DRLKGLQITARILFNPPVPEEPAGERNERLPITSCLAGVHAASPPAHRLADDANESGQIPGNDRASQLLASSQPRHPTSESPGGTEAYVIHEVERCEDRQRSHGAV